MTRSILSRSAWTTARNGRAGRALSASRVIGIAVHYPAAGNVALGSRSRAQVAELLRGWRAFHVHTRGWADIGYNFAVDGAGRIWDLTGYNVGAHAGSIGNPSRVGVLFVLGNNEDPTPEMIAGFRDLREHVLQRFPKAKKVEGHRQVPGNATACPGTKVMALIQSGDLVASPAASRKPSRGARVDTALKRIRREIRRLRAARTVAKAKGRTVRRKRLTKAIRAARDSRRALKEIRQK